MKKFFKKNKKVVITSIILSLVLVAGLVAVKGIQIFAPSASSNNFIVIKGAVAIDGTDAVGKNRFTKLICPKKPFKSAPEMEVDIMLASFASERRGIFNPVWDCIEPNFSFIEKITTNNIVGAFKLNPPNGYKCVDSYIQSQTGKVIVRSSSCYLNYTYDSSVKPFVWFKVKKI